MKEGANPQEEMADRLRRKAEGLPSVLPKKVVRAAMKAAWPKYVEDILTMRGGIEDPGKQPPMLKPYGA